MILKGSQRGGAKQLAQHLLKTTENEHVEVHEVRGFISDDLQGALHEAYAVSRGTRCQQFLFSLSLNPPESENVPVDAFEDAVSRVEKKLGLEDQPRAIVFHEKEGRRHAHAVWSRIDAEEMKAVQLSHFKNKLQDVSKELYLEHGWTMPKGFMDKSYRDPRNFTLAEHQQAKRMGHSARDLKQALQECWAVSDSKAAFQQALESRGLALARGDRRGYVAVSLEGEVLSLPRALGKTAKDMKAKLGQPGDLDSVDEAKARFTRDMALTFRRHVGEANERRRREMAPLDARRQTMAEAHRAERSKLISGQQTRWENEARERASKLKTGLGGLWQFVTGRQAKIRADNEKAALAAIERDRAQRQALVRAQLAERQRLQSEIRAVRQKHAEALLQLRRDRQDVKKHIAQSKPAPSKPKSPMQERFAKPAAPEKPKASQGHSERLKRLREGRKRDLPSRDQGHEHEP